MLSDLINILEGDTFVVSDRHGDIDGVRAQTHGLFQADTRFLSGWTLTVDGKGLSPLSIDDSKSNETQYFLVHGTGTIYADSKLSVIRRRSVANGFHEDIRVLNHGQQTVELDLRLEAAADFADLFEVKDKATKRGNLYSRAEANRLVLGYRRESFARETYITATEDARFDDRGLEFHLRIPAHGSWGAGIDVEANANLMVGKPADRAKRKPASAEAWISEAPSLETTWPALKRTYWRSLTDLASLRLPSRLAHGHAVPAAGLPWFMAIFGRDSLIVSFQALPFLPDLAETTLRALALLQGTRVDDFRDEDPGKILHELRWGELTAFEERPHSPYYGSADSTPLFLVLLDEYERWTGNTELVRTLEPAARAALRWIDEFGDRDGDGYVEYERRNKTTGLENQCWKDSWDSIAFGDGRLAEHPHATCEIQGYVYDAKMRCARLARGVWNDPQLADKLTRDAGVLKERFNKEFWVKDGQFFALALDGKKRRVDSLTSNIGHLLWSGIADDDKAAICAQHLLSPRLFSGWGVRTMAEGHGSYNPVGYHVGTVWPHDNSLIAAGLRRYGYDGEAARIGLATLEAAEFFAGRLPEVFAGYNREATRFPVEYPTACSPQAWAAAAPLLILSTMLGLRPDGDELTVKPAIPNAIGRLELRGIKGRWGSADALGRGDVDVPIAKTLSQI